MKYVIQNKKTPKEGASGVDVNTKDLTAQQVFWFRSKFQILNVQDMFLLRYLQD